MYRRFNKYMFLTLAILLFAIANFLENRPQRLNQAKQLMVQFQQKLKEKEIKLLNQLENIRVITANSDFSDRFLSDMFLFNQSLEKEGTGFLIYRNNKILYWSDREIAFQDTLPFSRVSVPNVVFFPNGYYLAETLSIDSLKIIGLILLKYNYTHENQYLHNTFYRDFKLPEQFDLAKAEMPDGYPIKNIKGEIVFFLIPPKEVFYNSGLHWFSIFFYLAGLILLLIWLRQIITKVKVGAIAKLSITGSFMFLIYWTHVHFHIPGSFYRISFFSPVHFALNSWLPSLGDFFLFSSFMFYFLIIFYQEFRIRNIGHSNTILRVALSFILFLIAALLYILADYFIGQLIYNSSFTFTLNKINQITIQTAFGIASAMFLFFGLILLLLRITMEVCKLLNLRKLILVAVLTTIVAILLQFALFKTSSFQVLILFLGIFVVSAYYSIRTTSKYGMSYLVLFVTMITFFSLEIIYRITVKKEREVQKLMAVNLVTEHDPAAEVFLVEIMEQLRVDPNIPRFLVPPFNKLDEYIGSTYFSGFFRQFDLQVTICTGADSLTLQPQNSKTPCFPFFENMIKDKGIIIPGTNFYYMDNMDGRITYLGKLHYRLASDSLGVTIFIDLKSKIQSEGIGFPELLTDKSMRKPASYNRFEYGKYSGGELVDRHGSYKYNYYIYSYNFEDNEFTYKIWDGYEHLIHKTGENNYVIVSRRLYTFVDYLISFPYLFVFYFLFSLTILFLIQPSLQKNKFMFDLKFRIQAAIISIVFMSLLLVAFSTIFYNLEESRSRLQEDLDQKMNSVAVEIDMRLGTEKVISPEMKDWLKTELVRLSNIFQTDINIYGVDGNLVVSSRPEVFNRGLVSKRINTQAYYELHENFQNNYFQPEKIGQMSYLSAYEPIINNNGDYLGFVNLPYFTHQDKYSQEISTFIVAFINLYVLLFLASIIIAIFIANQITLPLVTIRENLRKIELGKRSEPINYQRDDEIGKLVKEYNKKVDELAVSAELLARSERESAWREMAKQVAHEIKNPLTPMKLNIQHLQRFRGEGSDYQEYVNRISQTLISQIDTLSDIATEFSNFAQIPTAMKQVFNLAGQISKVIELFENHERVKISFQRQSLEELRVNVDREQLSRALINLIKNGIQAIPEEREGNIVITVGKKDYMAIISVADNGTGIPAELQEKMFSPNFTTKTSGMGLGLAIVKNIAENFNGRVWYETFINKGTIFHLEIPVFEEKIQPS